MRTSVQELGRMLLLITVLLIGLVGGFLAGETICLRWVVPGWLKEAPHDGQLGLGVLVYALFGAMVGMALAGIVDVILILRDSSDPEPAATPIASEPAGTPIQLHLN